MRLSQLKPLPARAGTTNLEFIDPTSSNLPLPRRFMDIVDLPYSPDNEFYPLASGRQFLFAIPPKGIVGPPQIWFGGTDEAPFLVELRTQPLTAYRSGGEKGLFEALKPRVIGELERSFCRPSNRQGDIFAFPLEMDWQKVKRLERTLFGKDLRPELEENLSLFGTRHALTGLKAWKKIRGDWTLLGEGLLQAPDHTPRQLKGVHVIAQTRGILNPKAAD